MGRSRRVLIGLATLLVAGVAGAGGGSTAIAHAAGGPKAIQLPVPVGTLHVQGNLRDGGFVSATGVQWHPGTLPAGDKLLTFTVTDTWNACASPTSGCVAGADTTSTPMAAHSYIPGHADAGLYLQVVEKATEVIETDPATFTFRIRHTTVTATSTGTVASYPAGAKPWSSFVNGLPERETGSNSEIFQVSPAHFNQADGTPTVSYQIDGGGWQPLPSSRVFATGTLAVGDHWVAIQTQNGAGSTERAFAWRVTPLPAPVACIPRGGRTCFYPPHLDSTGRPMRWDWQIGRVAPLERKGAHAVDMYDVDGFLTTTDEITAMHTEWQAATLPHPKVSCYLDLAWEAYRPDGSTEPQGAFPATTLGNVYYGYPQERWVDVRQLDALKPMIDHRIAMCAAKGFDSVELDDIDSYDPPTETGFQLTPGDWQNFLAYTDNEVHRYGMTAMWKNSPLLAWWGRQYTDGAVVEECYVYTQCFSADLAGTTSRGITCTVVTGPTPCGWDAFTTDFTPQQPNGKWVGEDEYKEDGFVCGPGASGPNCSGPHAYAAFCAAVEGPSYGFSALRMTNALDGSVFQPCPTGT